MVAETLSRIRPGGRGWAGDGSDDGAEPWDTPIARRDRERIERWLPGRPFRPRSLDEVPGAAMPALEDVCGPLTLDRLFVVPSTVRPIGGGESVIAPSRVLGFGRDVVAAWIDDGRAGLLVSTPVDEIAAIEDRTILLYGRLRLIGSQETVVVRYNTVSREDLQPNLQRLRTRMVRASLPVPSRFVSIDRRGARHGPEAMPYKWRFAREVGGLTLYAHEPAMVAAGDLAEVAHGKDRAAGGMAALTGHELVLAIEPPDWRGPDRYGVDTLAVPRHRLDRLHWDGHSLTIGLSRVEPGKRGQIVLPLEPRLIEAAREAFGEAVRWV